MSRFQKVGWNVIKNFIIRRAADTRERRAFESKGSKIINFHVQLEIRVEGEWEPAIRWDTAHGFVDCDRYNLKGEKEKHILNVSPDEGLTDSSPRGLEPQLA